MTYNIERCRNLLRTGRDRYEKAGERVPESINVGDWLLGYIDEMLTQVEETENQADQIHAALVDAHNQVSVLQGQCVKNQQIGMADGWDEGYAAGVHAMRDGRFGIGNREHNPYR